MGAANTTTPDGAAVAAGRARAVAAWSDLRSPRLGMRGYLCVIGYITAAPATSIDVAQAFGFGRQHTRELINRMGEIGLAHTTGKIRTGRSGPLTPLWSAGPGPIARNGKPCREMFPELSQLARILRALEDPCRVKDLARDLGAGYRQVQDLLNIGRALKIAHVVAWDMPDNPQGGGVPVACWVFGAGRDAPRPKPVGKLATKRAWYARTAAKRRSDAVLGALTGHARQLQVDPASSASAFACGANT